MITSVIYTAVKLKPEKILAWMRFEFMTSAIPMQCSTIWAIRANWELVTLLVRNIPVDGEECKWMYERWYIWTGEKDMRSMSIEVIYIQYLRTRNEEPFVSRAKAAPAKTIRKGYGDETVFDRSRFAFAYLRLRLRNERDCLHSNM